MRWLLSHNITLDVILYWVKDMRDFVKDLKTGTVVDFLSISARQMAYWKARDILWDSKIELSAGNEIDLLNNVDDEDDDERQRQRTRKRRRRRGRPGGTLNRKFTIDEVLVMMLIRNLLERKFPTEVAQKAIVVLRAHYQKFGQGLSLVETLMKMPSTYLLLSDGEAKIFQRDATREIERWLIDRNFATIVNLANIAFHIAGLNDKLAALASRR